MQDIIEQHKQELISIARRYGVKRLEVFGSAASGEFDSKTSDVDLLVNFREDPPGGMADAYFGLLEELEKLFGRHVDLVTERSIKNPYFKEGVNQTRRPVYAE